MTESGTPLERAETNVHKAQAVLGEVDQVLQTIERAQATPEAARSFALGPS
jgi:hypothetical protein